MSNGAKKSFAFTGSGGFPELRFILSLYVSGLVVFTLFRILFLVLFFNRFAGVSPDSLLKAFLMGLRFDMVVSGYILLIPILISFFGIFYFPLKKAVYWLAAILYAIAFTLSVIDIPFFLAFNSRLTATLGNWLDDLEQVFFLIVNHRPYLILAFPLAFAVISFAWWVRICLRRSMAPERAGKGWRILGLFLVLLLILVGIRGRFSVKSPMRWGTAFIDTHPRVNQLGLNPVFTFFESTLAETSWKNQAGGLLDDRRAESLWRSYPENQGGESIEIQADLSGRFPATPRINHVLLIIMESMGSVYLGSAGKYSPSLTPFLDQLQTRSLYFSRFFANGIHTYNAVWALFGGMPSAPGFQNPLKDPRQMNPLPGMVTVLKDQGFRTLFACPHDAQFDNMAGFLRVNGIDTVLSPTDFPGAVRKKSWEIPDHLFFGSLLPKIRTHFAIDKPGFFSIMTISNHPPYGLPDPLPDGFRPHSTADWSRAVEYADWSLGNFFSEAQKEPWFDQTLFVLVADHGVNAWPRLDINLHFHQIPLFFFAPALIPKGMDCDRLGMQTDLFPTMMHVLGRSFENRTLGVDLLHQGRRYAFFTEDRKLGVYDGRDLLILERTFPYFLGDGMGGFGEETNRLTTASHQVVRMREYALAHLQVGDLRLRTRFSPSGEKWDAEKR